LADVEALASLELFILILDDFGVVGVSHGSHGVCFVVSLFLNVSQKVGMIVKNEFGISKQIVHLIVQKTSTCT